MTKHECLKNDESRNVEFRPFDIRTFFRHSVFVIRHFTAVLLFVFAFTAFADEGSFDGQYYCGRGDADYLRLLDISRRMFAPDPQYQNISMLYTTNWNGFVEGETWGAWWIQNSYGTTYAALPFLQ